MSGAKPDLPQGLQLTELDPAFRVDPHAPLNRLRDEAPVHWDPVFGGYFLTRYNDVRAVLTDRALLRDADKAEDAAHFAKMLQAPPPGLTEARLGPLRACLWPPASRQ